MSAFRLLVSLCLAIFGGDLVIMLALHNLPIGHPFLKNLVEAFVLTVIVFPLLYFFVFKTLLAAQAGLEERISERTSDLENANEALERSVRQLGIREREMVVLGEMGNLFQACRDLDEAMVIAETQLHQLFPDVSGALFLMNSSRNILEKRASWGQPFVADSHHRPEDCWGLRRSKPHVVTAMPQGLVCNHMRSIEAQWHVCVPLTAQGEALGTLCLVAQRTSSETEKSNDLNDERIEFYVVAAENLALAIANLRLRETLRHQALRDPLTGLFNRRYLLETLDREIDRAGSRNQSLSIVIFDIDHFKKFNDSFGHAAGDAVLVQVGSLLCKWVRGEDIPSRYGGEEFAVVFPDTTADQAFARAESLRQDIEALAVVHDGQLLGRVTISVGIATFPHHAMERDALIGLADRALYDSKQRGRNCTTVTPETAGLAHLLETAGRFDAAAPKTGTG